MSGALKRKAAVSTTSTITGGTDAEDVSRKVLGPNDDFAKSTKLDKDGTAAKRQKNRQAQKILQTQDNVRLMLVPESQENTNKKDISKCVCGMLSSCY